MKGSTQTENMNSTLIIYSSLVIRKKGVFIIIIKTNVIGFNWFVVIKH
jgi:hypothetical protein